MSNFQTEERGQVRRQWVEQAIALAMQNRWADAAKMNQSIHDAYPDDTDTLNRLGRALTELGRYKEARESYQSDRSETWLDSDARETFDERTDSIEQARDLLAD